MEPKFFKIPVCVGDVSLHVAKGHFATRNSHTNYFIDVTNQQSSIREAEAVAQQLAQRSLAQHLMLDTILCMDGTRVIGTCLAQKLTQGGFRSINAGKEIYVLRENVGTSGKLIFRDNARFMLAAAGLGDHRRDCAQRHRVRPVLQRKCGRHRGHLQLSEGDRRHPGGLAFRHERYLRLRQLSA